MLGNICFSCPGLHTELLLSLSLVPFNLEQFLQSLSSMTEQGQAFLQNMAWHAFVNFRMTDSGSKLLTRRLQKGPCVLSALYQEARNVHLFLSLPLRESHGLAAFSPLKITVLSVFSK